MDSIRARDNRFFLYKTVFPFLQKMPTAEDQMNGKVSSGTAVCNLNHYIDNHDNRTAPQEITDEFSCGRDGCLAGWYVMLSDRDKRFGIFERKEVSQYDNAYLARHFGLEGYNAGEKLFGTKGSGIEGEYSATTRIALRKRKQHLRSIMEEMGDFSALKEAKATLRLSKVFGYR